MTLENFVWGWNNFKPRPEKKKGPCYLLGQPAWQAVERRGSQTERGREKGRPSSETQGQLVGAGKSLNGREKNSGEEKSKTPWYFFARIFFFSRPFRPFPTPLTALGSPRPPALHALVFPLSLSFGRLPRRLLLGVHFKISNEHPGLYMEVSL